MERIVRLGSRDIGDGQPTFIVAEIGVNHNGDIKIAKQLIDAALRVGVDAVKFQKRDPVKSTPKEQRNQYRDTPWGYITYIEYRQKVEFCKEQYQELEEYCKKTGINWLTSVWDRESIDFMKDFAPLAYKIPSHALTDHDLVKYTRTTGKPMILSTGMSTMQQIKEGVMVAGEDNLILLHCTSAYPAESDELNMRMIETLRREFKKVPVGYSGHEVGLVPSTISVAFGACMVERHITLDRAMWGSDQAASLEPGGFERLVKYIRQAEMSLGDGVKRVYKSEQAAMLRNRRISGD